MTKNRKLLKELVDVTGFEPATPCLQRRVTRKLHDLARDGSNARELSNITSLKDY
jgi:hypothetical protein